MIVVHPNGHLTHKGKEYRCAIGRGGVTNNKSEGDGCTPVGCFPIREVLYRADRLDKPACPCATHAITEHDAWCEDAASHLYNQRITVDATTDTDRLWREDHLYDVVAVLGYNDNPAVPGKGSAIFMHVSREGYTPTAGCIALALGDILTILAQSTKDTEVCTSAILSDTAYAPNVAADSG